MADKDPRGFVAQDVAELRSKFPRRPYDHKTTKDEIMYIEGTQKVIQYIEDKMVTGHGFRM